MTILTLQDVNQALCFFCSNVSLSAFVKRVKFEVFGKSNHSTCIVHFNVTTVIRLLLLWSDIKGPCGASSVNVTMSQASFPFLFLLGAEVLTTGSVLKALAKVCWPACLVEKSN